MLLSKQKKCYCIMQLEDKSEVYPKLLKQSHEEEE